MAQSLHLDLSKLSSARSTARVLTSSTGTVYACLGVSVTGLDIGDSPGLQCGHPGVVAGPLDPSISAVDLMVPAGPSRRVTVFGIEDPLLCATFDARSLHAAKGLGSSAVFDFFDDASVSVKLDFNNALAFPDCNPTSAPNSTVFSLDYTALNYPTSVAADSTQGYLYIANYGNGSINKFQLSTGALIGSIGYVSSSTGTCVPGTVATAWCTGGTFLSGASPDPSDGRLGHPNGIALSGDGLYLYVADSSNHRIVKFTASTGSFLGWIGGVGATPTGGSTGCSSAAVGSATPGWCTGGQSASGNLDGILNSPNGIAVDTSGNLYVADTGNKRISKYNASGVFQGWIGWIASPPTGGAAGCNGAAVSTFTPGWCTGGYSTAGNGDGAMSNPQSVAVDSSGNLYVADSLNNRVSRYSSNSGSFVGWIGKIYTSPTGGSAGCNGAAPGTATPGWCTGGTASDGTGDGMFNLPYALSIDSSGNLYIADRNNNRISKYNSTGVYQGSIGKLASVPTGGATGCTSAPVNSITPGWCTGATYNVGTAPGEFLNLTSVAVDSSGHIYDIDNNRFQRLF